jgi:hypothetical protein
MMPAAVADLPGDTAQVRARPHFAQRLTGHRIELEHSHHLRSQLLRVHFRLVLDHLGDGIRQRTLGELVRLRAPHLAKHKRRRVQALLRLHLLPDIVQQRAVDVRDGARGRLVQVPRAQEGFSQNRQRVLLAPALAAAGRTRGRRVEQPRHVDFHILMQEVLTVSPTTLLGRVPVVKAEVARVQLTSRA